MIRRKKFVSIRKFIVLFFCALFIIIWLNHESCKTGKSYEQFPKVQVKKSTTISRELRVKYLRQLVNVKNVQKITTLGKSVKVRTETAMGRAYSLSPSKYFVNNKKCKIPYAKTRDIVSPVKLRSCSREPDIFRLIYDFQSKQYKLQLVRSKMLKIKCNYRGIKRNLESDREPHEGIEILPRVYFHEKVILPRDIRGIIAECHVAPNDSKILQQDGFSLVQVPVPVAVPALKMLETKPKQRQPSVFILGLNSMSRMDFQRTMPLTAAFVRKLGWVEMEGYNKMADDNLPNMLPILTGLNIEQFAPNCIRNIVDCVDGLPWIWKDYKNAGYTTAMAEDVLLDGLVSKDYGGFIRQPTDEYLSPVLLALRRSLQTFKLFGIDYCIGRRLSISYVYDFCVQFTQRYVEELERPTFGFYWSGTGSRVNLRQGPSSLDKVYVEYLQKLESHKLFEHSIVIMMSNHGSKLESLDSLDQLYGFLEVNLPLLHIYLPPWFRVAYPNYATALHQNRNRLSSNFDLHNTLRHILQLNASTPAELSPLGQCPSSQSLLHPLPVDRGCLDACIAEPWCTCNDFVPQFLTADIYMIGKQIVYEINRWMLTNKYNKQCQRILLQDMDYAERRIQPGKEENSKDGEPVEYRLAFHTHPQMAKFQATIRYNHALMFIENLIVPEIRRLGDYKKHSECVQNEVAKKFCICYPKDNLMDFMRHWQNFRITTFPTI